MFSLQGPATNPEGSEYLETQARKLRSNELALEVIRDLHLAEEPRTESAAVTNAGTSANPDFLKMTQSENAALLKFKKNLSVRRETGSRIITVSYAGRDPQVAANATNALVDHFIEDNRHSRHDQVMASSAWLAKQLDDIRDRTEQANRALAQFQERSGLVAIDDKQSTYGQQVAELNKQLLQAQADRMQMQAYLGRLREGGIESLPQINSDAVLQDLTKKLNDSKAQLAQASVLYGKNHPNIKRLESQVKQIEDQIARQRQAILGSLRATYAAAGAREQMMQNQLKSTSKEAGEVAKYEQLKKEAEANSALYNALYTKIKEAGIAAESKSSNIQVIDRAQALHSPTRPHRSAYILFGLFGGLLSGIVFAFAMESLDNTIQTAEDVRTVTGLSNVSEVPVIGHDDQNVFINAKLWLSRRKGLAGPKTFLLDRPYSAESEAMHGLHTSIRLSQPGRSPRVLLIASPLSSEGKTTVALNLAIALARSGRTCLIDADMRNTNRCDIFGVSCDKGLSDVLTDKCSVEDVTHNIPEVHNLSLLRAGTTPPDPVQLVSSKQMSEVLANLRNYFEFVVIDSPPLLPFADARAMSTFVDGVVLVARSSETTRDAIVRCLELLAEVHSAPIVDVVLNATSDRSAAYSKYYKKANRNA